MKYYKNRNEI